MPRHSATRVRANDVTTLARSLSRSASTSADRDLRSGCWVDVFDEPGLGGESRRLLGPASFPDSPELTKAKSLIVGPAASILIGTKRGLVRYSPGKSHIVADLRKIGAVGTITSLQIEIKPSP
jgi:hypothetical protein